MKQDDMGESAKSSKKSFPFLNLPPELHNMVYKDFVLWPGCYIDPKDPLYGSKGSLLVSK